MAEITDLEIVDASNTARMPENQAPSTVNNGVRALEGLLARGFQDALEGDKNSTGSSNTYAVAANRTISAYYDGMRIGFHANFANTGAATLNVDAVGAKAIVKNHDIALASGDIEANQYVDVVFSASDDAFQMVSQLGNAAVAPDPSPDDLITTRGDIIRGDSSNNAERLALGAVNRVLTSDGSDAVWTAPTAVIFSESFTSSEQTITAGGSLTLAHSLSATPDLLQARLVCKSGEFGYSIGDELVIQLGQESQASTNSYGVSVVPDGTNLNVRFGSASGVFLINNKTTGGIQLITAASWKIVFRAWN